MVAGKQRKPKVNWKKMSDEQILEYRRTQYNGVTRYELHNQNSRLYYTMIDRGLIEHVPRKNREPRQWSSMSDADVVAYRNTHYRGVSNSQLQRKVDGALYNELKSRGLLSSKKPRAYYADIDNVMKEIVPIINSDYRNENGVLIKPAGAFPTNDQLGILNGSLLSGIMRHHGRLSSIRKLLDKSKFPKLSAYLSPEMIDIQRRLGEDLEIYIKREYDERKRSTTSLGEELGVEDSTVYQWLKLFNIPTRTVSEGIRLRNRDKLVNLTKEELIEYGKRNGLYGLSPTEARTKDERYYFAVWRRGLVDIIFKKQNGHERIASAPSFREFVETHEDAQKAVRLFAYSDDMVDPLVGRILALWYPHLVSEEDAIEYLPSLGPWLGRFRKPRPSGDFGDVLGKIPMPAIDKDQLLRGGFLKLGRDHYMSLMNAQDYPAAGDEQSFLDLIKEKAEGEPNETLRWLHGTLYDEFSRFFEIMRESRRRRPVPEEVAVS